MNKKLLFSLFVSLCLIFGGFLACSGQQLDTAPNPPDNTDCTGESCEEGSALPHNTEADEFSFSNYSIDHYLQRDRAGFPGSNLLLNVLGDKNSYNRSNPQEDASSIIAFSFNTSHPIAISLDTWHRGTPGAQTLDNTGLDDDLMALGLTPCLAPPQPGSQCEDQIAPLAVPDVLKIKLDDPQAFPNGRRLQEPVTDQLLAYIWVDFESAFNNGVATFLDRDGDGTPGPSLNPLQNDKAFLSVFPYLAESH